MAIDLLFSIAFTLIAYGNGYDSRQLCITFGACMIFCTIPATYLVGEIYRRIDPSVARAMYHEINNKNHGINNQKGEIVVKAVVNNAGFQETTIMRGLEMDRWREIAKRVEAAQNFTVDTIGRKERKILLPMMIHANFVKPIGNGQYELTDSGAGFWNNLATRPYPWKAEPKTMQMLPTDRAHT